MWVAKGCAQRFKRDHVIPKTLSEWIVLAEKIGLVLEWVELPFKIAAFRVGNLVMLNHGLSVEDEIEAIKHEVAHWTMHRGNALWWQKRPMGEMIIAKMERQANEFAELIPDRE